MRASLERFLGTHAAVAAPCPHVARCGGCAVQDRADASVADWKRSLIIDALAARGVEAEIAPTVTIAPGTRRRATLAARRDGRRVTMGFNERRSDRLVDLETCLLLTPRLETLLPALRSLCEQALIGREEMDLALGESDAGVELTLRRARPPGLDDRESWAAFATTHDLARLAWRAGPRAAIEPVAARRTPILSPGGVPIALPAESFLQPSRDGERVLVDEVCSFLAGATKIADLFSGIGTFGLPLAVAGSAVTAIDADKAAIDALSATRRVLALRRDLFRAPLSIVELAPFDAILLDPPRAGAQAQSVHLAHAAATRLCYVSCNPSSFARDARLLVAGGWSLISVLPVDQFRWSAHVELVARFAR